MDRLMKIAGGAIVLVALGASCNQGDGHDPCALPTDVDRWEPGCENPGPYAIACSIREDLTLCADRTYHLDGRVFVDEGATLTVEPGARLEGSRGATLLIERGASMDARGTSDAPIVMTCDRPEGERYPGCWGGLVLLGEATINDGECVDGGAPPCGLQGHIKGHDVTDDRGLYGGSDDHSSCGSLEYVRLEFIGTEYDPAGNGYGLTFAGCGDGTTVRRVQVHRAADDGIEIYGGTFGMVHVVISGASDDSLDWDEGWRGDVQFLVIHQFPGIGDNGMETDNLGFDMNAAPRSAPTLWNVTLCGNYGDGTRAARHREGTAGVVANAIVQDFTGEAMDVNDDATVAQWMAGHLAWSNAFFWSNELGGTGSAFSSDNTMAFDLDAAVTAVALENVFDQDPGVDCAPTGPDYVPTNAALVGQATPGAGFDNTANYAGAFEPNGVDWTAGWTAYPVE